MSTQYQYVAVANFCVERHKIYLARQAGKPKPWTKDSILQQYRFCNVYRELDAVTKWIHDEWLKPNQDDPDLWFAMFVARYINEPETLDILQYPVPWKPQRFAEADAERKAQRKNTFNAAYIISTGGQTIPKVQYLTGFFNRMWQQRKQLRPLEGEMLQTWCDRLIEQPGIGSFMAAQVVADMKHAPVFRNCKDWWSFAASGPGSRRGLGRIVHGTPKYNWNKAEWKSELDSLRHYLNNHFRNLMGIPMPRLDGQNTQNVCCEWDKYQRAVRGEGRPKQKFAGV